jgi:hypothetical protein
MLDFPELFAPAKSVSGRTSIVCSTEIDLNPATESVVIVGGSWEFPFDLVIWRSVSFDDSKFRREHYCKNRCDSEVT